MDYKLNMDKQQQIDFIDNLFKIKTTNEEETFKHLKAIFENRKFLADQLLLGVFEETAKKELIENINYLNSEIKRWLCLDEL